MSSMILQLGLRTIVSPENITFLRDYISQKWPAEPKDKRAAILGDAINKIVDTKIPNFSMECKKNLRDLLIREAISKSILIISYSDVFEATVKLKVLGNLFFKEMTHWLADAFGAPVKRESVFKLVMRIHKLMDVYPEKRVSEIIAMVELEMGGLEFNIVNNVVINVVDTIEIMEELIPIQKDIPSTELALIMTSIAPNKLGLKHEDTYWNETVAVIKASFESICRATDFLRASYIGSRERFLGYYSQLKLSFGQDTHQTAKVAIANHIFVAGCIISIGLCGLQGLEDKGSEKHLRQSQKSVIQSEINVTPTSIPTPNSKPQVTTVPKAQFENKKQQEYPTLSILPETNLKAINMRATAYDLSVACCGKTRSNPEYGITYTGTRATKGRTIAVDPKIIPLGSKVRITFPAMYKHLDGVYIAEDTGGLIKGNRVDIFLGEDPKGSTRIHKEADRFGIQNVEVLLIK